MPNPVLTTTSDVAGRALATLTEGIARLRPSDKPLHPEGTNHAGRLVRSGSDDPIGVPWLDDAGEDDVLVRTSHALGLPGPIPDVDGLAVRLRKGQTRYGDLLLASTGWDRVTRHVLLPAFRDRQPLTTLLPYRSPAGPLVIGAVPSSEQAWTLHWALVGRPWRQFGELELTVVLTEDDEASFDPVLNPLPGLQQYAWVEHLRERSYARARAVRRS